MTRLRNGSRHMGAPASDHFCLLNYVKKGLMPAVIASALTLRSPSGPLVNLCQPLPVRNDPSFPPILII